MFWLGEYRFLLKYEDDGSKFVQLRPLLSSNATEIAEELIKIFFTFGAPNILQRYKKIFWIIFINFYFSNRGNEFVAEVIKTLQIIWPGCKMVIGRPCNKSADCLESWVEKILRNWMFDRQSSNWSRGCYEVQVRFWI